MKILHVCKKYPPALGGDAVVVANLQKQLQAAKHQVVIVTSNCRDVPSGSNIYKVGLEDTPAGLDTITPKRLVSLTILCWRMFAILRKERPDVIHTHSIDMAFFVSFAARLYRVPIIHTFHIVTFYDASQSFLRRKSELWLAKKAHLYRVTAPNTYDVKKLQEAGLKQATLLPNGVDIDFWKPESQARQNRVFTFVTVGRIERQKGCEYLIKAASLLSQKTAEPFQVVVVGEGSQEGTLRRLAKVLHIRNVVFVGGKSPQETRNILAQADTVVCPSLYETTPLTLLEAWAMAKPVIVTRVGIMRDATSDYPAASVVPPEDVHSLTYAMRRCMTEGTFCQNMAQQGYREAQKYTWPIIARTAEAIYRGGA